MSRAFVKDDLPDPRKAPTFDLPLRDDPAFDAAAAAALLEGARVSEIVAAEDATGLKWGEPRLRAHVERILAQAEQSGDDRLEQVARRFLKQGPR
jgi:hypothetical protein